MAGRSVAALKKARAPTFGATAAPIACAPGVALSVEAVSHSYGPRRVLDNVNLAVPLGGFTALLGPNGAGKTTLLSLITRLFETRHGRISVLGFDVAREPRAALARLGVVFQARTLDLELTLRDNLLYHAALHGIGWTRARMRTDTVLADVGLLDRARDKARRLSGGQMRRVEIARALMHEPRVLILDEATVGLDVASKGAIISHMRALSRDHGVAVLWATHLLDEIEPGDQVVVLHEGRVLADGEMTEVIAATGATDLRMAFRKLTRTAAEASGDGDMEA